jgi:hypothetical protein
MSHFSGLFLISSLVRTMVNSLKLDLLHLKIMGCECVHGIMPRFVFEHVLIRVIQVYFWIFDRLLEDQDEILELTFLVVKESQVQPLLNRDLILVKLLQDLLRICRQIVLGVLEDVVSGELYAYLIKRHLL